MAASQDRTCLVIVYLPRSGFLTVLLCALHCFQFEGDIVRLSFGHRPNKFVLLCNCEVWDRLKTSYQPSLHANVSFERRIDHGHPCSGPGHYSGSGHCLGPASIKDLSSWPPASIWARLLYGHNYGCICCDRAHMVHWPPFGPINGWNRCPTLCGHTVSPGVLAHPTPPTHVESWTGNSA